MRVEVSGLTFSSAHLIAGHEKCECLHGHNWRVSVTVEGEIEENGMVMDFLELRKVVAEECSRLDHRVLLPEKSKHIKATSRQDEVKVEVGGKAYSLPAQDVLFLPVKEVTAEEIARLIAERLLQKLPRNLKRLEVKVEEAPGQSAVCTKEI
jgi:6-pyruvoyltetrahydropterin/6-carboxytetrahydropterin synthase